MVYDVTKLCTAKYTDMLYKQSSTFDVSIWYGTFTTLEISTTNFGHGII